jgi:hypothetical protein
LSVLGAKSHLYGKAYSQPVTANLGVAKGKQAIDCDFANGKVLAVTIIYILGHLIIYPTINYNNEF